MKEWRVNKQFVLRAIIFVFHKVKGVCKASSSLLSLCSTNEMDVLPLVSKNIYRTNITDELVQN